METKDENIKYIEYTGSEKWDLFGKNYTSAWRKGFTLEHDHAKDSNFAKVPFICLTILHVGNGGILTAFFPSVIKTIVDLCTRKPLTKAQFHNTCKYLDMISPEQLDALISTLVDTAPSSNSSMQLVADLNKSQESIKKMKDALRGEGAISKSNSLNNDFETNLIIASERLDQRNLLGKFFVNRVNIGKKTQHKIFDIVEGFRRSDDVVNNNIEQGFKP